MFTKILIANRGEIACRIIRTCHRLGIETIAIYSEADTQSLHVKLATQAYYIGPAPASSSYLNIDKIIQIAQQSKAQAIHPGYGFLSENAEFAAACEQAKIIFIGPRSDIIASMGNKDKAKTLMQKAGVPVIPSTMEQNPKINFPVIIKATFGGGGKGMRIVHTAAELPEAINSAKRESLKSFGSDSIIIEKYIPNAKHIEIQIFGDHFGNTVHLFERDCSLQRRHQKIIEETPAQDIPIDIKNKLYQAALKAVQALNYANAGTIEFLYDPKTHDFYFLEMNTRLQVEHAITEMTTGLDLVEWQLLVAANLPLPLTQAQIKQTHHAIEARIYAEDPYNDFLPATGTILQLIEPDQTNTIRIESGLQTGDMISIHYDPMLSKMIVLGENRTQAIEHLKYVLNHYEIMGVITNLRFLRQMLDNPDFLSGNINTQYLQDHPHLYAKKQSQHNLLAPAILAFILNQYPNHTEDLSPWGQHNAWQLNGPAAQNIVLIYNNKKQIFHVQHPCEPLSNIIISGGPFKKPVSIKPDQRYQHIHKAFSKNNTRIDLFENGNSEHYELYLPNINDYTHTDSVHTHSHLAPMPGVITHIFTKPGTKVNKGDKLIAIEAMKMEHTLCAHQSGLIKSIYYNIGDQVQEGCELFEFEGTP